VSVPAEKSANVLVVLVVEDEFLIRCSVAECLRDAGYVVVEADNGEKAIALCTADTSIDIVFTDINLGGSASGWDVAECFQRNRPTVPVLYTSGKVIDFRVPGSAFVSKPYKGTGVLRACQRLRIK
jgi:CheY-like chemotaxis protein